MAMAALEVLQEEKLAENLEILFLLLFIYFYDTPQEFYPPSQSPLGRHCSPSNLPDSVLGPPAVRLTTLKQVSSSRRAGCCPSPTLNSFLCTLLPTSSAFESSTIGLTVISPTPSFRSLIPSHSMYQCHGISIPFLHNLQCGSTSVDCSRLLF